MEICWKTTDWSAADLSASDQNENLKANEEEIYLH